MACATEGTHLSTVFITWLYTYINFDQAYNTAKKRGGAKKSPYAKWNNAFWGKDNILNGISAKALFAPKKNRYGFVIKSDQYCVKADGLYHAKLGCLLWAHHKGHLSYAMKLNQKHVFANYLHKGNDIVPGDVMVIKQLTMKVTNDFSMFGVHSESSYAPLITIHDINRKKLEDTNTK